MVKLNYISEEVAKLIEASLNQIGIPTENRVLILSPKGATSTSGLIIPEVVKEGMPKKGVVVQLGIISEEYKTYRDLVQVGRVVTYGLYAGKELELDFDNFEHIKSNFAEGLFENHSLTVLSLNEIVYSEINR